MGRGASWAIVCGVAKSQTQLSRYHTHDNQIKNNGLITPTEKQQHFGIEKSTSSPTFVMELFCLWTILSTTN